MIYDRFGCKWGAIKLATSPPYILIMMILIFLSERSHTFPAVTVCTSQKLSGFDVYSKNISENQVKKFISNLRNFTAYANTSYSPKEYGDLIAMTKTKRFSTLTQNQEFFQDFLSPKVSKAWGLKAIMSERFIKNVNSELHNMTQFDPLEILASCTFNIIEDCRNENRFIRSSTHPNCFTFNAHGNEQVNFAISGLEMVLFMNSSETESTTSGMKAFTVVIHPPRQPPFIERDGILFETGRSTTIRVKRFQLNRVHTTDKPCNTSLDYSKTLCIQQCVMARCVGRQKLCDLYTEENVAEDQLEGNHTGYEFDLCYLSGLYIAGINATGLKLFQVEIQY